MFKKILWFFYRPPDFIIGAELDVPYLLRWHVIPRNKYFNIYLHKFLRDDDDRAKHDHPFASISFLISGEYIEETSKGRRRFRCPSVICRSAEYAHRIELINNKPAWTIFITGPRIREWGFHCPSGWVQWEKFIHNNGCGEK